MTLVSVRSFICLCTVAVVSLAPAVSLRAADKYVEVRDGHLSFQGQRLRLWGAIGSLPAKDHAGNAAVVTRLEGLGFNAFRLWRFGGFNHWGPQDSANESQLPGEKPLRKGDGSPTDLQMHAIAELKKRGMFVWFPALAGGMATPEDVNIVDDPATAEAWAAAVRGAPNGRYDSHHGLAVVWDPRLEAVALRSIERIGQAYNPYTGLRLADDPVTAVTELTNEQWWFMKMIGGQWQKIPNFFQRSLLERWQAYLKEKYKDDEGLRAAWSFLLPGESLDGGGVRLLPMAGSTAAVTLNDANEKARAAVEGVKQAYSPSDFTSAREADVIDFFLRLWIDHKKRLHDRVKAQGKAWASAPTIWDTGIGYEMQSAYLHQLSDATSHCTYLSGFHHDPSHKRFPWYSGLDEPPRLAWNDPWVEQNRAPNKPFLMYETQIGAPAKYRAEYPLRLVALAAIQDWDAIMWHTMAGMPDDPSRPGAFDRRLDYNSSGNPHPQGFHYTYDEVQNSSMRAAGAIFRSGVLSPAPKPTTFVFGRRSLLSLDRMNYGPNGKRFAPTTWRYGMRLLIDPEAEKDRIEGPSYTLGIFPPNPLTPTPELTIDWHQAFQKIDHASAASYVGFLADYRAGPEVGFNASGTRFRSVTIRNAPGMAYPVKDDERFAAITLAAVDGLPFERSRRVVLSAVATSENSGFKLDESKLRREFLWTSNPGATVSTGKEPVLVSRVGVEVANPALDGMRYEAKDWHLRVIASGEVRGGVFRLPDDKPVFLVEFTRP